MIYFWALHLLAIIGCVCCLRNIWSWIRGGGVGPTRSMTAVQGESIVAGDTASNSSSSLLRDTSTWRRQEHLYYSNGGEVIHLGYSCSGLHNGNRITKRVCLRCWK
jgi:hypothetical protein